MKWQSFTPRPSSTGSGPVAGSRLQIQPESFGVALLPFAVITPAAVGAVALADSYRPLRRGVPHAIAAGLYLGFGEALWLVGYQHAYATYHDQTAFEAEQVSTVLWVGSTVGAGVGGLIGALGPPTPGRMSFTASVAIWSGLLGGFAAGAIEPDQRQRGQASYLVGGIAYNAGLLTGILLGGAVAPSVARMRFVDLGGLFGALVGAGGYALIAQDFGSRGSFGTTAIGGAVGLGLAWWATAGMPSDRDVRADRQTARNSLANLYGLRPVARSGARRIHRWGHRRPVIDRGPSHSAVACPLLCAVTALAVLSAANARADQHAKPPNESGEPYEGPDPEVFRYVNDIEAVSPGAERWRWRSCLASEPRGTTSQTAPVRADGTTTTLRPISGSSCPKAMLSTPIDSAPTTLAIQPPAPSTTGWGAAIGCLCGGRLRTPGGIDVVRGLRRVPRTRESQRSDGDAYLRPELG